MQYSVIRVLGVTLLTAVAQLQGYNIVSNPGVLSQPACSIYTVYYTDLVDLALGTTSLFSNVATCTGTSSTTSTFIASSSASATPSSNPSVHTDGSAFVNPGFECTTNVTDPNFGWLHGGQVAVQNFSASGVAPRTGSQFASMYYDTTSPAIGQFITNAAGNVTITLWANSPPGAAVTNCVFIAAGSGSGSSPFVDSSGGKVYGPSWGKFTASFPVGANALLIVGILSCSSPATIYVDDISFTVTP